MAKRPINRSQADDSGTSAPAQPRARRSRATPAAEAGPIGTAGAVGQARPVELDPEPPLRAALSPWQPSEDDIRVRAYHRFLERGGGHGQAFDDWLEAERELRLRG